MTNYEIYQINSDRDTNRVKFWGYDFAVKKNGTIDLSIYDKIYQGQKDVTSLDNLFMMFNIDHPKGFHGHSMSVSDIVKIISSDVLKPGYFFCDSFGWREVEVRVA